MRSMRENPDTSAESGDKKNDFISCEKEYREMTETDRQT